MLCVFPFPIPLVDRECGDPRNILRVIVDEDDNETLKNWCKIWDFEKNLFTQSI